MDIVSGHRPSFSRNLWVSVMIVFLIIATCFMLYQYRRERTYRADIIDARLQAYNEMIANCIGNPQQWPKDVRVTILRTDGSVIWDNADSVAHINHIDRPEIQQALKNGKGRDIRRKSKTVGDEFFYSATKVPTPPQPSPQGEGVLKMPVANSTPTSKTNYQSPSPFGEGRGGVYIIRTALPYNNSLIDMLSADKDFIWLACAVLVILAIIYEGITRRIGRIMESKRRKMENKLEQSEEDKLRIKRQLTQNVAHELKTPVSSIQGFLDILIADDNLPEEQKQDFLKRSHAQATRLANILRDISMLTRIDDVPTGFEKTDCNLHEIVDNVATDLASNLQKHGDIVQNNIPADCTLQGNYSLLYSIFRNLVDNSIAYAGENITITVETCSTVNSQQSIIEVIYADNGKGIP